MIFAVNRSQSEAINFEVNLSEIKVTSVVEFSQISGFGIKEVNDKDNERVYPTLSEAIELKADKVCDTGTIVLECHSIGYRLK